MKSWKACLAIALVFIAGFASGAFVTRVITRQIVRTVLSHPERLQPQIERRLTRSLRLDPHQQGELRRVLIRTRTELMDLRRDSQPRAQAIINRARQEISAVLTPEQRAGFEAFLDRYPIPALSPPAPAGDPPVHP